MKLLGYSEPGGSSTVYTLSQQTHERFDTVRLASDAGLLKRFVFLLGAAQRPRQPSLRPNAGRDRPHAGDSSSPNADFEAVRSVALPVDTHPIPEQSTILHHATLQTHPNGPAGHSTGLDAQPWN